MRIKEGRGKRYFPPLQRHLEREWGGTEGYFWENKWLSRSGKEKAHLQIHTWFTFFCFCFFKINGSLGEQLGDLIILWQMSVRMWWPLFTEKGLELLPGGGIYENWVLLGGSASRQIRDFRNSNALSSEKFFWEVFWGWHVPILLTLKRFLSLFLQN